jgi:flagellar biosynthesis/type III secretory pathway M-ring protein FliF/YscJ
LPDAARAISGSVDVRKDIMHSFSWLISMATPNPAPSPVKQPDPELVTPGFLGFAIVAILVIAVVLLVWDMQRRIRRARYRAEIDAQLDAEQQADAAVRASDTDDQFADGADDDADRANGDPPPRA